MWEWNSESEPISSQAVFSARAMAQAEISLESAVSSAQLPPRSRIIRSSGEGRPHTSFSHPAQMREADPLLW